MKLLILAVIVSVAFAAPPKPAVPTKPLKPATTTTPKPPPRPVYVPEAKPQEPLRMLTPMQLTINKYEDLAQVPIVRSESSIDKDGFNYLYETGNGISGQAIGTLKKVDNVDVINMEGQFQYPGAQGEPVQVAYTADENGYHPRSDILPTPPPTPDYVYRLLKYNEEHPNSE